MGTVTRVSWIHYVITPQQQSLTVLATDRTHVSTEPQDTVDPFMSASKRQNIAYWVVTSGRDRAFLLL